MSEQSSTQGWSGSPQRRLCVQHGGVRISLEMLSSRARHGHEHSPGPQGLLSCTAPAPRGSMLSRKEIKPPQPYTTASQKSLQDPGVSFRQNTHSRSLYQPGATKSPSEAAPTPSPDAVLSSRTFTDSHFGESLRSAGGLQGAGRRAGLVP